MHRYVTLWVILHKHTHLSLLSSTHHRSSLRSPKLPCHIYLHLCMLQVLLHKNDYAAIALYAGSCLLLAIAALLLPIETKGKSMKVCSHSHIHTQYTGTGVHMCTHIHAHTHTHAHAQAHTHSRVLVTCFTYRMEYLTRSDIWITRLLSS